MTCTGGIGPVVTAINRVAIIDTETSGLDASKGHLLEVGLVVWDVRHLSVVSCFSTLLRAPGNDAEHVNGIPAKLVQSSAVSREDAIDFLVSSVAECDAIIAHGASFDRQWLPELHGKPWVCSMNDLAYPKPVQSKALSAICLAHGLGVSHAHRALTDCMMIARLLERCAELGVDVGSMISRGMRTKAMFAVADTSYDPERNAQAKGLGFRWHADVREWRKAMAIDDVGALPFAVRQVG